MDEKQAALELILLSAAQDRPYSELMALILVAVGLGATYEETDKAVRFGRNVIKVSLN